MVSAATDMTGWWVGYGIGALVVVIVVVVVVAIIATARKIADVAEDGTRSLILARDRTEVLWQVATTNTVANDLLQGAMKAREALGGGSSNGEPAPTIDPTTAIGTPRGLGGAASGLAGHDPPQHPSGEERR
ncbi:MAG: hypothetical protein M3N53_14195 [Actinomycetota bacterium]|nr:hypothetical protein [Actinomycetota bacterium]